MSAPTYSPLEIALIEEGRFMEQANADLMEVQKRLLEYRNRHKEAAKGAKAKLVIEITLCCENPKEHLFSIKALTKQSVPNRPPTASLAITSETMDGESALFVRRSGSDSSSPRQGKLSTDDGRTIDPATGEVAEPSGESRTT